MDGTGACEVTVLEAKPVELPRAKVVLVVCGLLVIDVLFGVVIAWWLGVGLAVLTVVQLPLLRKRAQRHARNLPGRLEVRADRITTIVVPRGDANEIRRSDGDLLAVRDLNGEPHLCVVGPAGDNGSLALGRFDVEAVGRAALAHGWPWQPPGGEQVLPPAAPVAVEPADARQGERAIALRGGRTRTVPAKGTLTVVGVLVTMAIVGLVAIAVSGPVLWGMPGWVTPVLMAMAILVPVGVIIGAGFLLVRLSAATVTIGDERISVKYGSLSANVVHRSSISSGTVGDRWVRMRNHDGKQLLWVPLRPKRDEVLAALRSHGWPITDG